MKKQETAKKKKKQETAKKKKKQEAENAKTKKQDDLAWSLKKQETEKKQAAEKKKQEANTQTLYKQKAEKEKKEQAAKKQQDATRLAQGLAVPNHPTSFWSINIIPDIGMLIAKFNQHGVGSGKIITISHDDNDRKVYEIKYDKDGAKERLNESKIQMV